MVFYILFALLFIILIMVIVLTKLNIAVEYNKSGKNDHLIVSIFAYGGLIKYKYEIPGAGLKKKGIFFRSIKEKGKKEKDSKKSKEYIKYTGIIEKIEKVRNTYDEYEELARKVLKYLKCRVSMNKLDFHVLIGTGNASQTAILTGLVWTVTGIMFTAIYNFVNIKEKHIDIKSDFVGKKFKIDLYCIFKVKVAHIIVVGFMILTHLIRTKLSFINFKRSVTG